MKHYFQRLQNKARIFFIVNSNVLLNQQAKAIEDFFRSYREEIPNILLVKSTKKGFYKQKEKFRPTFKKYSIFVIMDQIFLRLLRRGFLRIEEVDLLIFDECHHADSNHKYNRIIQEFYLEKHIQKLKGNEQIKIPKILGLTASPIKRQMKANEVIVFLFFYV